ncbi:hypothetical protein [Paraburkholderia youngii]|uniref:hypothetical protein n=1 Tax=Paraburkholderia youngii TaxID=2782701 RepID=UPI003D229970
MAFWDLATQKKEVGHAPAPEMHKAIERKGVERICTVVGSGSCLCKLEDDERLYVTSIMLRRSDVEGLERNIGVARPGDRVVFAIQEEATDGNSIGGDVVRFVNQRCPAPTLTRNGPTRDLALRVANDAIDRARASSASRGTK